MQVTAAPSWVWSRSQTGNCVSWFWILPRRCQTPSGCWAAAPSPPLCAASGNSPAAWSTNSISWWSRRVCCRPRTERWDSSAIPGPPWKRSKGGGVRLLLSCDADPAFVISQIKIRNSKTLCAEKIPWRRSLPFIVEWTWTRFYFQEVFNVIVIKCFQLLF